MPLFFCRISLDLFSHVNAKKKNGCGSVDDVKQNARSVKLLTVEGLLQNRKKSKSMEI